MMVLFVRHAGSRSQEGTGICHLNIIYLLTKDVE